MLSLCMYVQDGTCVVHDLFGKEVVDRVREGYGDAYQTAHFEVPGDMFALAMEAKQRGMGVVGSTQNILNFIEGRVKEAIGRGFDDRLQFVLGTEAGMVTAIVGGVSKLLGEVSSRGTKIEVEIVFPVSSEAISATSSAHGTAGYESTLVKLPIVPGVASGEGCSLSGGCASCPYMKVGISCLSFCLYLLNCTFASSVFQVLYSILQLLSASETSAATD